MAQLSPSLYELFGALQSGHASTLVSILPKTFPKKTRSLFFIPKATIFHQGLHQPTPPSTYPPQPTTLGPWAPKPHPFQGRFQSSHFTHRKGRSPRFPPPTMCWTSGRLAATGPPIGAINPYKWPYNWLTRVISPL